MVNNILNARVFHKRLSPVENKFEYSSLYLLLKNPKIPKSQNPSGRNIGGKLLSFNKFNLYSFYDSDHATRDGYDSFAWANDKLKENNVEEVEDIKVLTHPRFLGYVFNPISFWLCFDKNQKLIAVICEVNNTLNKKKYVHTHSYLIHEAKGINPQKIYKADKKLYVSPFYKNEGHYEFRFSYAENKIAIFIDYFVDGRKTLITSVSGTREDLNSKSLLKYAFKKPFVTFKTSTLIIYQAFKLKFKGLKMTSDYVSK